MIYWWERHEREMKKYFCSRNNISFYESRKKKMSYVTRPLDNQVTTFFPSLQDVGDHGSWKLPIDIYILVFDCMHILEFTLLSSIQQQEVGAPNRLRIEFRVIIFFLFCGNPHGVRVSESVWWSFLPSRKLITGLWPYTRLCLAE